ncbi:complex I NDUFA9 subunit family protein [Yoonia litorea]|uniref:NADH dehydrogenase n=1 Tax=Yoonia litorea TaxID=1123755 RepID=A0A1I6MUZ0_9RHOB|nr:complex I NDUFA9 subunit family protein [Yoonia litorea]SFS19530.1 NADH dehydrogenase [Yoonia litorea]
MSKLVTIFGGSGFVGRYIARRMAKEGWRVRVAVRNVNEAMFVRPYGVVGQVEPVFCNIRDDASVALVTKGADAVVNCVGVLDEVGKNTFSAVQAEGAERIARIAAEHGITRMVHISAIGADENAQSEYSKTKAAGEAGVLEHMPHAVILRPSIIFGPEDQFFNRFASMSRLGPVLPVVGAETKFQPVYVDDVAAVAANAVLGDVKGGVYELGGPDVHSFRELMHIMLDVIRRRRLVVGLPFWFANIMATGFSAVRFLTAGLVKPPVTKDQIRNLAVYNVVSEGAQGFDDLGLRPTAIEAVLPDYLWRFRPSGQYDAIKESAKNLKA